MWRDKALCQIHQSFNSPALLMKRQIIYEKLFNFSRWFILVQVITIHQVKSLPSARVSILIPEFGYTTISLDYSALPWNMYPKRWFYLVFARVNYTFLQSAAPLKITYCMHSKTHLEYLKVMVTETCWVSLKFPEGGINWSWTYRKPSVIYLSNCSIYSSHQAINVFSVYTSVFPCTMAITLIV